MKKHSYPLLALTLLLGCGIYDAPSDRTALGRIRAVEVGTATVRVETDGGTYDLYAPVPPVNVVVWRDTYPDGREYVGWVGSRNVYLVKGLYPKGEDK